MSNDSEVAVYEHLGVRRVGGNIGAEIRGVIASGGLADEVVRELRQARLRHRVVFLRDQGGVDADQQLEFASLLGVPTKPHPTVTGDGRAVLPIDSEEGKANSWHTDVTFVDRIPAISVLRAVTLNLDPGDITTIEDEGSVEDARQAWRTLQDELERGRRHSTDTSVRV